MDDKNNGIFSFIRNLISNSSYKKYESELPVHIARQGEKVIALICDEGANGVRDDVSRGRILTVDGYDKGSYTFKEFPADYNPYLGDVGTCWFSARYYQRIEPAIVNGEIGEKVVAIEIDRTMDKQLGITVNRGEILTVKSYDGEHYEFHEYPPRYDIKSGKMIPCRFDIKNYHKITIQLEKEKISE